MKLCAKCLQLKEESEFHRYKGNPDGLQYECKSCALKRFAKHREKCRKQKVLNYSQRTRQRLRLEILKHYGGDPPVCACCKEDLIEFLTIDHIDGGGNQHKLHEARKGLYNWLKKNGFPSGYRVLCCNCNQSLGHYGYCPHQHPDAKPYCPSKKIYGKKLSDRQREEIKKSSEIQWKLALKYNVSQQTISRVKASP